MHGHMCTKITRETRRRRVSSSISFNLLSLTIGDSEATLKYTSGDVFVSLPTGAGKSLCFTVLPSLLVRLVEDSGAISRRTGGRRTGKEVLQKAETSLFYSYKVEKSPPAGRRWWKNWNEASTEMPWGIRRISPQTRYRARSQTWNIHSPLFWTIKHANKWLFTSNCPFNATFHPSRASSGVQLYAWRSPWWAKRCIEVAPLGRKDHPFRGHFVSGSGGLGTRLPCTWKFSRDEIFANFANDVMHANI